MGNDGNRWIAHLRARPRSRVRLLCFHYAGGTASSFRTWNDLLPECAEVIPIQLPGREARFSETPLRNAADVVVAMSNELGPLLEEKPFVLFGHSMGALLAFELAQRLIETGASRPMKLLVSGCRAPSAEPRKPFAHVLEDRLLIQRIRELGGTSEEVLQNQELMSLLLPTLRADFELVETYRGSKGACIDTPIVAFAGTEDTEARPEEVRVWHEHTTADFRLKVLAGDHFFIRSAEKLLLVEIREELSRTLV